MGPIAKIKSKLGFGNDGQRDANGNTVNRPRANTAPQGREYTAGMVDVLDTLGMSLIFDSKCVSLTRARCRSANHHFAHQRPELSLRPQSRSLGQSPAHLCFPTSR